jgi:hypothetical protein
MGVYMSNVINFEDGKEKLTQKISEQYSQNIINMEEYERILEYINKIETKKELGFIEKIIAENNNEFKIDKHDEINRSKIYDVHFSMFSSGTIDLKSINDDKLINLFSENKILIENIPPGRTTLNVGSILSEVEIIIGENIKVTNKTVSILSEVHASKKINSGNNEAAELYIVGVAILANIKIKTIDEFGNGFGKKIKKIVKEIFQ